MKIFSVFMSVLLIFSMCLTANAAETEAPVTFPMGDVNLDGSITADDARLILRTAVGLDCITREAIVYGDCDFDGSIGASDARLALRTAVGLEEKQSYSFEITETKDSTCAEEGFVKAKCAVTGKEVRIVFDVVPHTYPYGLFCAGKGNCTVCGAELIVEVAHEWTYWYLYDRKECANCGVTEYFEHNHNFNDSTHLCECGHAPLIFEAELRDYLIANGTHEGYEYYIGEYIEPLTFAFLYNEESESIKVFCGFAVESDGVTVYYEFYFDFKMKTVNTRVFIDDIWVANLMANITPGKVDESADGDAISLTQYEVIPDLNGMQSMFRIMIEGTVYDMVQWMLSRGAEIVGCDYMEHVVADFINVK